MAYAGISIAETAKRTGSKPDTVKNWKGGAFPEANRTAIIRELSRALGVPLAWFTADLTRLDVLPTDPRFLDTALDPMPGERPTAPPER